MSNRNKIINVISAVLTISLGVTLFVFGAGAYSLTGAKDILLALLLFAAGVVVWYFVHNAAHELIHALFCSLSGGKVTAISFDFIAFYFQKGEKKVRFDFRNVYGGWTQFVVKRPEKAHVTLYFSLLGGLVGTIFTAAVLGAIYADTPCYFTHFFVLSGLLPVLYSFAINFLCDYPTSDGRKLPFGDKGLGNFAEDCMRLETERYLTDGKSAAEAYPVLMAERFYGYKKIGVYDYLAALEKGNVFVAEGLLTELEKNEKYADNGVIDLLCEKFFIACVKGDKESVEKLLPDAKERFYGEDVFALRVHAAYRAYTGEAEWAALLRESYFKECGRINVEGLKKTCRKIGENYLITPKKPV